MHKVSTPIPIHQYTSIHHKGFNLTDKSGELNSDNSAVRREELKHKD